jgi:hypothetical protein
MSSRLKARREKWSHARSDPWTAATGTDLPDLGLHAPARVLWLAVHMSTCTLAREPKA